MYIRPRVDLVVLLVGGSGSGSVVVSVVVVKKRRERESAKFNDTIHTLGDTGGHSFSPVTLADILL